MAQGMTGESSIEPSPFTYFDAAYLGGWSMSNEWPLSGRFDFSQTDEERTGGVTPLSGHGNALTFAVNYLPKDRLRLTGEFLRADSTRGQRGVVALSPHKIESQFQA